MMETSERLWRVIESRRYYKVSFDTFSIIHWFVHLHIKSDEAISEKCKYLARGSTCKFVMETIVEEQRLNPGQIFETNRRKLPFLQPSTSPISRTRSNFILLNAITLQVGLLAGQDTILAFTIQPFLKESLLMSYLD